MGEYSDFISNVWMCDLDQVVSVVVPLLTKKASGEQVCIEIWWLDAGLSLLERLVA